MPSRSIHNWTVASLLVSYFDLALAYFLLIGSTLSFFLPCPYRIQTLLFTWTRTLIESLLTSILTRFPFDLIFNRSETDRNDDDDDRVGVGGNRVRPVIGRRIRRRRALGARKGQWVSGLEGVGGNFGGEKSKDELRIIEDGVSMVGEASPATKYCSLEGTSSATSHANASKADTDLIIKNLEQELKEAHAAHAALYLELEKERNAAATAADEAMAMILRLQSEKAALEMESRQYQRMVEEKSAYDEEEMETLKEIIVRREREKYVLEKEVEMYQLMKHSCEFTGEKKLDSLFDSSEDPTLMLKTMYESIGKQEEVNNKIKWTDNCAAIHDPNLPDPKDECNINIHEKGIVSVDVYPSEHCQNSNLLDGSHELGFCKEPSCLGCEKNEGSEGNFDMKNPNDELDGEDQDEDQSGSDPSRFETESSVIDVHVIDDNHDFGVEGNGKTSNISLGYALGISREDGVNQEWPSTSNVIGSADTLLTNWVGLEQDIQRSYLDINKIGQLMDTLGDNASQLDRRSSMSAIDIRRFKLETEVEILRKRLKTLHRGRENLSFSLEYREKENFHRQLLEEIACHLQEINKITEPGKSIRQASLPPLSSKVASKKRRCRSIPCGLHESA